MARSITFEDAVRRAVKSYYDGATFDSYEKVNKKPSKYNLDMFDEVQSSFKKRGKKKKKETLEDLEEVVQTEEDDNG